VGCGERGRAQADPSARWKEVVLDQRPQSGQVWIRIIWQTGAVSEHKVRRNVSSYRNYADVATLEARVRDLVVARKMDREIARTLNADGLLSAHGRPFSGGEVHLLRKRWDIPTVKINQTEGAVRSVVGIEDGVVSGC
jgi:hypothetical protein